MALPKLKGVGACGARASNGPPTDVATHYDVAWRTGMTFRNSDETVALCITPVGKNPDTSGLHLTREAAIMLALDINTAATAAANCVEITNTRFGLTNVWERFTDSDARMIAVWINNEIL